MRVTWPLVGRDEELSAVRDAIDDTAMSGVVLAGAAGVGKTRLAREVLASARARGLPTRWAVATQAASIIPFGALAHLLPDLGERAPDHAWLLQQAIAALGQEAGTHRLVLGVDDAHLLDPPSAALVHQLAATSSAFLVVAVRTGEPVPDPILALWKDGLAERLELQALSFGEIERLVRTVLGGQVDGLTLHRLWEATQGNSLLLRELVLAGLELGVLGHATGIWRWNGPLGITARLTDLIEARLGRLTAAERDVLELVAAGEPLGAAVIERLAPPEAVDALERKSLVAVEQDGRRLKVRLAHPLYGEVLRRRTPTLRARAVHRQLADTLQASGMRRRDDLPRVAILLVNGGADARSDLLTAAARQIGAADSALAERLARAAVDAGGGLDAGIALGQALSGQRRFEEAEGLFAGLVEVALTARDRANLAIERAANLWRLHRYRDGIKKLQGAAATLADHGLRDRLATTQAEYLLLDGRCSEALEVASTLLAHEPADDATFARAAVMAAWALVKAGRASEALGTITTRRGRLSGRSAEAAPWRLDVERVLCTAYLSLGRFAEAQVIAEATYRQSVASHWGLGVERAAFCLLRIALARGQVQAAVRWGQEGLAQISRSGDTTQLHFQLILPLALAGDLEGAEAAMRRADAARLARSRLWLLQVEQARCWIAAGRGTLSSAVELAVRAADLAESMGVNDTCAVVLHDAGRLGGAAAVAPRLRTLAHLVDGPLVPLYAAHTAALVAHDGAALDQVTTSFETLGALLLAAEAAAEAATAHGTSGRMAAARASAARSRMLAGQCEGARTPALRSFEQLPELTRREREIAGLAAAGLSNRAIAERLVVSIRTVDNHLQHVLDKLGISSRRKLGPLVGAGKQAEQPPSE